MAVKFTVHLGSVFSWTPCTNIIYLYVITVISSVTEHEWVESLFLKMKAKGKAYHSVNVSITCKRELKWSILPKLMKQTAFLLIMWSTCYYFSTVNNSRDDTLGLLLHSILFLFFTSLSSFTLIQNINIIEMLNETLL